MLSHWVYDGEPRLGAITDFASISDLPVTYVESPVANGVPEASHLAATCPAVIEAANGMKADLAALGTLARDGRIPGARVTAFNRARAVVLPIPGL